MAHVPQMYSLYELYFDAALERARALKRAFGDTVQLRQFYIDRELTGSRSIMAWCDRSPGAGPRSRTTG